MSKKKRQKSSSTAVDATSKSASTNAVDRTAGTTDASRKDSHGRSTVCYPLASPGTPDARPSTAHPEAVVAPPTDPRDGSPHSSARRLRKAKNKQPKAPSALAEEAPARITSATETAAPSTIDTAVGAKDAGSMNTHRSSAFTAQSPPSKLWTSHSALGQPEVVASTTSASHVTSSVTPLDHVLVFGHGKFQWIILFCTQLAVFCNAVHAVAMTTLARPVDHWCRPLAGYGNLSPEVWKNSSIPVQEDGSYSRCFRYEPPFAPYDAGVNSSSTVPCDAGWAYAASIHISIIVEWDLVCNRRWILLAMMASYMGSTVIVMSVAGVAADQVGRVPVLAVALLVLVVAGTTLAFATTLLVFAILHVLVSVSVGSLLIAAAVLLFEVTDSSRRVLYYSIAIAGGVSTASVYGEIVYDLTDGWVLVQMVNMLPSALLIGAVYIVEEPPNWLLATHRVRRLCKMAMSAAHTNGANLEHAAKRLEGFRKEDRWSRSESSSEGFNEASPLVVLTDPSFRSTTLVAFGCWFLAMSLFDRLRGSRDGAHLPVYYVQIALECPAVTASIFLLERKGRRIATAICMVTLGFLVAALGAFCFILQDPSGDDGLAPHLETTVRVAALLAVDSVHPSIGRGQPLRHHCRDVPDRAQGRRPGLRLRERSVRRHRRDLRELRLSPGSGRRARRGLAAAGGVRRPGHGRDARDHQDPRREHVPRGRRAHGRKGQVDARRAPEALARGRRASSLVHMRRKSSAVSPS